MSLRDAAAALRGRGRGHRGSDWARGRRDGSPQRADHPTLLDQVLSSALEPDYEHVARQRAAGDGPPGPGNPSRRRWATAAVLGVFVLLVLAAGREDIEDEPADALVRETLVKTASEKRQELADLQGSVESASQDNAALATSARAAAADRAGSVGELRSTAAAAGFQSVTGPGLRMDLTDAPGAAGGELLQSNDLALLVDGLWEAGAEAISIDGQRLTARSAITSTGDSINVNRRPLTPPYALSAIGDPQVLEAQLAETQGGQSWLLLVRELGFGYAVEPRDQLVLPEARDVLLRTCGECFPNLDAPSGQQQAGEGAPSESPEE